MKCFWPGQRRQASAVTITVIIALRELHLEFEITQVGGVTVRVDI